MMKLDARLKCGIIALLSIVLLAACGDDDKKPATSAEQTNKPAVSYSQIPQCDEYLNAMQACANSLKPSEEQEKLAQALAALGSKMTQMDDKDELKQHCQQALSQLEAHKKALGCTS